MLDPQDIRKHEFTRAWRGYDRDEVHALLDAIARDFEDLTLRNATLKGELKELRDEAARYQKSEQTLQEAALAMQQAMEEKRRADEEQASRLLSDARARIAEETLAAETQIASLRLQLQTLENERSRFYLRFQNVLNEQSTLLESLMDTPATPPADDVRD